MTGFYNEKVIDHFNHPRNIGVIKDADAVGYVGDPAWGIDLELYLKLDGDIIKEAMSKTFGCGATIATGSVITEMLKGKSLEEALKIGEDDIDAALGGLPPSKAHCARLGRELIQAAIKDYYSRQKKAVA